MRRFTVWVIGMQLGEGVKFSDGSIVVYWFRRTKEMGIYRFTGYNDMIELVMDNYMIEWLDVDDDCTTCKGGLSSAYQTCPACCNPLGRPLKEGESLPIVK